MYGEFVLLYYITCRQKLKPQTTKNSNQRRKTNATNPQTTCRNRRRVTHGYEVAETQLLYRNTSARGHLDARRRTEDRQVLDGARHWRTRRQGRVHLESVDQTRNGSVPCARGFTRENSGTALQAHRRCSRQSVLRNRGRHTCRRSLLSDRTVYIRTSRHRSRHHRYLSDCSRGWHRHLLRKRLRRGAKAQSSR